MNITDFETKVRYKLRGRYGKKEYEDKAVQRIINLRHEFRSLLASSKRTYLSTIHMRTLSQNLGGDTFLLLYFKL